MSRASSASSAQIICLIVIRVVLKQSVIVVQMVYLIYQMRIHACVTPLMAGLLTKPIKTVRVQDM